MATSKKFIDSLSCPLLLERKRILITTPVGTTPADSEALSVELSRQFFALFTNRFDSSIRRGELGAWRQVSRFHFLTDDEIKGSICGLSDLQRAFKLDVQNRFVVVKMLENSADGTSVGNCVYQRLNDVGLKPKLYKFFDESYIYIFLSEPIDCASASQRLSEWCQANLSDFELAAIRVISKEDSIPFPLQRESIALVDSYQSKNDLLKRFIADTQDGITLLTYADVLSEPSAQPNIDNDNDIAQTSSSTFWDFLQPPALEEQPATLTVSFIEPEKDFNEFVPAANVIVSNPSFAGESRQSGQLPKADHTCVPSLTVASGQSSIDATTNGCVDPSLANSVEPAESCLSLGKKESVSRQALCNEHNELTDAEQSQVVLPRHANIQNRHRSRLSEVEAVPNLVPTPTSKKTRRSAPKPKPLKESKQLSLKLSEQRETRAPP